MSARARKKREILVTPFVARLLDGYTARLKLYRGSVVLEIPFGDKEMAEEFFEQLVNAGVVVE